MTLAGILDALEVFRYMHPFCFTGIMYLSYLLNTILLLPLYGILSLSFAFIIDDFILGSILIAVLPTLVTVTIYFSVPNKLIPYLRSKLQKFKSFKHLDHSIDANSYSVCLVIRFLYIPVGVKEFTLLVLRYPFKASLFSAVVYYTVHGIIFAGVGSQLHNINEMFNKTYWSNMTFEQKADLLLVLCSLIFTVSVFIYITVWYKNKMTKDINIDMKNDIDEDADDEQEETERLMD